MIGAIRIVRGKLSEMGFSPNQATKVQKIFVPQATLQKKLENNRFFGVFMVYGLAKSQKPQKHSFIKLASLCCHSSYFVIFA